MVVLDTSFLIDLERGDRRAQRLLELYAEQGEPLIVPPMAAAQYLAGFDAPVTVFARLQHAFDVPRMGPNEVMEVARLARLATERRVRPHWADLAIAAYAMLHATHVVTANPRDFQRVDVPALDHRADDDGVPAA